MTVMYEQEYYPPSFFALVCGRQLVLLVHIIDNIARLWVCVLFYDLVGKKRRRKRLVLAGNFVVGGNLLFESKEVGLN